MYNICVSVYVYKDKRLVAALFIHINETLTINSELAGFLVGDSLSIRDTNSSTCIVMYLMSKRHTIIAFILIKNGISRVGAYFYILRTSGLQSIRLTLRNQFI
jgi:hypothetical protein